MFYSNLRIRFLCPLLSPGVKEPRVAFKVGSHLMFAFASAFQEHVTYLSISHKCKHLVRTLLLVAVDSILDNASVDVRTLRVKEAIPG